MIKRIRRLNSLLKEVISEVIREDVQNPNVSDLMTVTTVSASKDLQHARVYISVIGTEEKRQKTIQALASSAGFIATLASKKVVLRHFPLLTFCIDTTVDKQMKIETILQKIHVEKESRNSHE